MDANKQTNTELMPKRKTQPVLHGDILLLSYVTLSRERNYVNQNKICYRDSKKSLILCYIARDMVSVYTVRKEGFQTMIHTLNWRYQVFVRLR